MDSSMEHAELFKEIRRIEIVTRRLVNDQLAGQYQSVFKVFDKENKGTIHIDQVNNYISMFEEI